MSSAAAPRTATREVVISVTEEDIKLGEPDCQMFCPVARAANRAGLIKPHVQYDHIVIGDGQEIILPDSARTFIRDFDEHETVTPFTFTVTL